MPVRTTAARAVRRIRDERGQALVEFGVLAPVILTLLIGVIQVGTWLFTDMGLSSATREAGRLLSTSKDDANVKDDVKNRLLQNLDSGIDPSQVTIDYSPAPAGSTPQWSTGTTVTMTASYPDQLNVMGVALGSSNMTASAQVRIQ